MVSRGVFITISGILHTIGILLITFGVLKQFDVPVFDIVFGVFVTEDQGTAILALGIPFTLIAFWVQTLGIQSKKAGRITSVLRRWFK